MSDRLEALLGSEDFNRIVRVLKYFSEEPEKVKACQLRHQFRQIREAANEMSKLLEDEGLKETWRLIKNMRLRCRKNPVMKILASTLERLHKDIARAEEIFAPVHQGAPKKKYLFHFALAVRFIFHRAGLSASNTRGGAYELALQAGLQRAGLNYSSYSVHNLACLTRPAWRAFLALCNCGNTTTEVLQAYGYARLMLFPARTKNTQ